ncbi:MAG: zinc-ribbon domain-containing protein [Pyrinomonadaceae bacterium]
MFCPKCGTQNPDNGKFCRACGTNLGNVSDALAGKSNKAMQGFEMMREIKTWDKKGKPVHWEGAITKLFTGIAFLAVTIALAFSQMGQGWWFWMLIPAFGALGSGVARIMQLKRLEKSNISIAPTQTQNTFSDNSPNAALPPNQTDYIAPESRYKTGDLVPPSVVEDTTRHLEVNQEGETMTLPPQKK